MQFPALKEAQGKLEAKRRELHTIFDEAGEDIDLTKVKSVKGTTREIAAHIRALNDEQTALANEVEDYLATQNAAKAQRDHDAKGGRESGDDRNGGTANGQAANGKTLGQLFVESKAYKQRQGVIGPLDTIDVELKTLMTTAAGFAPESTRTGKVVPYATAPLMVTDLIPQTTTSQSSVKYMEETTYTNAAVEKAEGGAFAEAALAYTERVSIVRKIPVFLPVTDEQLEDEPQVRGLIDNRLMFMVRQRLDGQILVGDGVAPNLAGILTTVGIQTQAKGADPVPDAIYKGMTLTRTTGQAMPNAVVLNPLDWQDIRLLRTADGIYVWGNPSDAGPERIWGLQVVQASNLTQNTGLVGDFANFSELSVRRGVDVQVSNSHGTFFVEGKVAIRADMRVAFIVYRPAAFCQVTGI